MWAFEYAWVGRITKFLLRLYMLLNPKIWGLDANSMWVWEYNYCTMKPTNIEKLEGCTVEGIFIGQIFLIISISSSSYNIVIYCIMEEGSRAVKELLVQFFLGGGTAI